MSDFYTELATNIIEKQEVIVGPLAWIEAGKVNGLYIANKEITIKETPKKILGSLVKQYETLFGQASLEVCKDAVRNLLVDVEQEKIPEVLL